MPTYRLDLEYEGTRYRGWQEQKNSRTVAGELRRAVEEAGGRIVDLGGSGRTDAGVHALEQVAHLRLRDALPTVELHRAINDRLPPDIHLLSLTPVDERFHARHAALSRAYLYQVSRRRTALAKRFVWWVKRRLDPMAMTTASSLVRGSHDFRLFCERPAEQTSTEVHVEEVLVAEAGALLLVRFVASHFLWRMVRRIVGCLVRVGAGEMSIDEFEALLHARPLPEQKGDIAQWTAPPSGLFLERVLYPGDPPLGPITAAVPVPSENRGLPTASVGPDPQATRRPKRDGPPRGKRSRPRR